MSVLHRVVQGQIPFGTFKLVRNMQFIVYRIGPAIIGMFDFRLYKWKCRNANLVG